MGAWKAILGVGAACAACCAVPLLGGVAALTVGTTTLAVAGSALWAFADEFAAVAGVLLGLAAMGAGVVWWKRRAQRNLQPASDAKCLVEQVLPPTAGGGGCGCAPGSCG